jgi:hypothetical protein
MYRLYQHVKSDGGHINEQIDRNTGIQRAAHDLTWSFANILSAMKEREKAVTEIVIDADSLGAMIRSINSIRFQLLLNYFFDITL